ELLKKKVDWTVLKPAEANSKQGATLKTLDDGSILASGANPASDSYELKLSAPLKGVTALRLEVLPDDSLPAKGPGRAGNGNFVLHELTVKAAPSDKPMESKPVGLHKAVADFAQDGFPIGGAIDGNPATGWAVLPQFVQPHS